MCRLTNAASMDNIPRTHEGKHENLICNKHPHIICALISDIEAQIREIQSKKKEVPQESEDKGVGLGESGYFDSEIYDGSSGKNKYEGYVTSIAANDEVEDDEEDVGFNQKRTSGFGAPVALLNDVAQVGAKKCCKIVFYLKTAFTTFKCILSPLKTQIKVVDM